MFDIAWSELLLVAVIAILVVGPKELPGLLQSLGRGLGKLRRTADDFRKHFDDAVREAGGDELQREMRSMKQNNPLNQIRSSIEDAARDPVEKRTGTGSPPAATDDHDDLGPPPPPLPPKNAEMNTPPPANPGSSNTAASKPAETPGSSAQTEDSATDPANNTQRLNGEHRAAG